MPQEWNPQHILVFSMLGGLPRCRVCQGLICPTTSSRDSSEWSGDLRKELPIPTDKEVVWDQWQRGMILCLPGNELESSSWTTAILSSVTWYKNTLIICAILGFRRDVDESCSLLRYYAAWSGTGVLISP